MVAIGGAWRQSAAVGGRAPPSREPSGIFERHPPVYAVGLLQRDRGAWRGGCTPGQKKRKAPQRAHTAGRHDRTGTLARDRVFGGPKKPPGEARVAATASRIPRAHPKKGNLLEMKSGQPVPCVGVAARLVALWVRYSALPGGVCRRTHGSIWRCRRGRNPRRLQDPQCLPCAPCRSPGNGCKRCPAQ